VPIARPLLKYGRLKTTLKQLEPRGPRNNVSMMPNYDDDEVYVM